MNLEVSKRPLPDLVLYDGCAFALKSASFDAVLCLDVLEHVRDDELMLREISRVLRPQGPLILTTPCTEHDFREITLPLGKWATKWSEAEALWGATFARVTPWGNLSAFAAMQG